MMAVRGRGRRAAVGRTGLAEFVPVKIAPRLDGRRQPSRGGTSRMMREYQVRFCERLGVKFPGPTRHFRQIDPLPTLSACPLRSDRVRTFAPQRIVAKVESRMGAVAWAMRQLQTKTVFATMAWQKCANAGLICRTALSAGRCQRRGLPGIGPAAKPLHGRPPRGRTHLRAGAWGQLGYPLRRPGRCPHATPARWAATTRMRQPWGAGGG